MHQKLVVVFDLQDSRCEILCFHVLIFLINVIDSTKLLSKYQPGGVQNGLYDGLIWT
jgi:hypothetical protein